MKIEKEKEKMNKEELKSRIAKKEDCIKKIEKRIDKWEFKKNDEKEFLKEYDWLNNFEARKEYYKGEWNKHCESELKYAQSELEEALNTLKKYQCALEQLSMEERLEEVPAFKEFLNNWEKEALNYYTQQIENYKKDRKIDFRKANKEYTQLVIDCARGYKNLEKIIKDEKERKYKDLVYRTKDVVGTITDCKHLSVGDNLSLNGLIIGTNGKAKVETIVAGGYNIQCLHFRVLVNKI